MATINLREFFLFGAHTSLVDGPVEKVETYLLLSGTYWLELVSSQPHGIYKWV